MRTRLALLLACALAVAGCSTTVATVESVRSTPAEPATGHLRAGFGKIDITPPPGGGLFGYGTEGARSRGHRMRLYARALVLEDPGAERIAFVLTDLGAVSAVLQRKVAERIEQQTGIGADRLIVSATHTHSGPGHFFGAPAYDEQASQVEGYDPEFTDALADGIARAVRQAFERMDTARAAWGSTTLWRQTRVRNEAAMERNPNRFLHPSAANTQLPGPVYRYIDPQLTMLRVDVRDGESYVPAGSLIIFPVHGTLNSGANELQDGDLHSIVMRALEQRIDPGPYEPDVPSHTVHLFANGAEGDIIADFSAESRCPAPAPRAAFWPTGPRRVVAPDFVQPVPTPPFPECIRKGRANAIQIGTSIADAALELHQRLESAVQQDSAGYLRIARMFDVLRASALDSTRLPCKPHAGPATLGGVEGGFTRLLNLTVFRWVLRIDTVPRPDTQLAAAQACRGGKKNIDGFERTVAGKRPFPLEAQLTVVRIGDVVIGTVPGEATTNAGARMRRLLAPDSTADFAAIYQKHLVLGLANGYVHYLTTPYEYTAQLYEGAATLYGPYSAEVIAQQLGRLARQLPPPGRPSPPVEIKPITTAARQPHRIVPVAEALFPEIKRELIACWRSDTLVARWTDLAPGNLNPADGALVQIQYLQVTDPVTVAWDDDPFLEVWHLSGNKRQAVWEARYAPPSWKRGAHRVILRERGDLPALTGAWLTPGQPRCRN